MTNEEIWRTIKGYESQYQVSDKGRVRSIKFGKERILKPGISTCGYIQVQLWKNGEKKNLLVHRLVAQTFIPNLDNLPQVNHIDENPSNNKVENLEWCDAKYNNNYGTRIKRISEKMTNGKLSKPVLQYTKSGEFVKEWKSAPDVQRTIGYFHNNISNCCNGKLKSAYGYVWKYKDTLLP